MAPWESDSPAVRDLLRRIAALGASPRTILIGIDGRGGSGKSTLARELARLVPTGATVVEFDDFYRPAVERTHRREAADQEIGGDFDWRRLRKEVLTPLAANRAARYRGYDWDADRLRDERQTIEPGGIVIVEGTYSTRPELRDVYDLTIWVAAPHAVRLRRGVERDGEQARERWLEEWMREEDRYLAAIQPAAAADATVDGASGDIANLR
jgi:uridine kinase